MSSNQVRYWMLTIPYNLFTPYLPAGCCYIKGQLEIGEGGYVHWQILVVFSRSVRLAGVKRVFGREVHCEPSRSEAANAYVWKEDTAVENTRFELGTAPRDTKYSKHDWDEVKDYARVGNFDAIDSSILVRYFGNLTKIHGHFSRPLPTVKQVFVYWGATGTGKSRRAWAEATFEAYPKIPTTKFWDGYRSHKHVVVDEFTGQVGITHMLQWLDRYPVLVEVKGSVTPLSVEKVWITSNIDPRQWYNDGNSTEEQRRALMRRFSECIHFETL